MGNYFCCSSLEYKDPDPPEVLSLPVLPRSLSERTLPPPLSTPPRAYDSLRG